MAEGVVSSGRLGRDFHRLWAAAAVSNLGDGVRLAAFPLLAATLTRDPGRVAGLTVALRLPWFLFAVPAGLLADRFDRRRLMALVGFGQACVMGVFGLIVALGHADLAWVYMVAFLLGVGEVTFDTTAQTMIPAVVARPDLERANGRLIATERIVNDLGGPPAGALLFAAAAALPFVLDAATFAVGSLLVLTIAGTPRTRDAQTGPAPRMRILDGFRWVWSGRLWRALTLFGIGVNLAAGATASILVLFALETLSTGEAGFGLLLAALGAGGVVGAIIAPRLRARLGSATVLLGAAAVQAAGYGLAGLANHPIVAGVALAAVQAGYFGALVVFFSLRQALVPDELLGRVTGAMRLLGAGALPVGAALGGATAALLGLRAPFLIAAGGLLLLPLLLFRALSNAAINRELHA